MHFLPNKMFSVSMCDLNPMIMKKDYIQNSLLIYEEQNMAVEKKISYTIIRKSTEQSHL